MAAKQLTHNSFAFGSNASERERESEFAANCDSFGRDRERKANKRTSVKVCLCVFNISCTLFFGCYFGNIRGTSNRANEKKAAKPS